MPGTMIIDGKKIPFTDEKNVLSLIRNNGIDLPTFCYHSELSVHGSCRMCSCETSDGRIIATCQTKPKDGLEIYTNSARIRKYRRTILELILATHDKDCTSCEVTGECKLQELAKRYGIKKTAHTRKIKLKPIDHSSPALVRNPNKCIKCGDCVIMCDEVQGIGALKFEKVDGEVTYMPVMSDKLSETNCVACGQCRVVCPTGAITIKNETDKVWDAIFNKKLKVCAQIAPAVRVALGENFGYKPGVMTLGKTVTAMKLLGFDEIYDTSLGADLTVMEESKEFIDRLEKEENLPIYTSCCPSWVKFAENEHPDIMKNISSCKSPQQMFATVVKDYAKQEDVEGRDVFMVSVMPCTAKKMEAGREEFIHEDGPEVDVVITTQELAMMIKEMGIRFKELEESALDMPFGMASGAGVIFGSSGGVAEAVLRKVIADKKICVDTDILFKQVRGLQGLKETSILLGDREVKIAVVQGLKNADDLVKKIKSGEEHYDLVEVMGCIGGCISGGGQPQPIGIPTNMVRKMRSEGLYKLDNVDSIKKSDDNPIVQNLYNTLLKDGSHCLHWK